MEFYISNKFEGGYAEQHRIPAYEAAQSLQGISRSLILISHYFTEGEIRKRAPFTNRVEFFLEPPRRGSVESDIICAISAGATIYPFIGEVTKDLTKAFVVDSFRYIIRKAIGLEPAAGDPDLAEISTNRAGDIDALTDAVEPSLRLAHNIVNNGVMNININIDEQRLAAFDADTKNYVTKSNLSDEMEVLGVSVGSLNVNTSYGRVYMSHLGKTVPFMIANEAIPGTTQVLAESLQKYAGRMPSDVLISFRRFTADDGRIKKILIFNAVHQEEETREFR